MDKETFTWVLQCALLNWDGVTAEDLISKYGADSSEAKAGVTLCQYLKSKEIKVVTQ